MKSDAMETPKSVSDAFSLMELLHVAVASRIR